MAGLFYQLGRAVGPKLRKARWMYEAVTGSEDDLIAAEHKVGADLFEAVCVDRERPVPVGHQQQIEQIGQSLAACVTDRRRRFRFTLIDADEANAFALPGGYVLITMPLLERIGDDRDAIAFVLGHEMGHVLAQHPMRRIFSDAALSTAVRALPAARGVAGRWAKNSTLQALRSAYSQADEMTADRYGGRFAEAAGFDPAGGIRLFEGFEKAAEGRAQVPLSEWFSSHPPPKQRIEHLRQWMRSRR